MYIRTKDGVFKLVDTYYMCVDGVETYMYDNNGRGVEIRGSQILKQSENLEELCDEIVYDYRLYQNKTTWDDRLVEDSFEELDEPITDEMIKEGIYGAIWTDKGLTYVAKMDNDGKLVLV